MWAELTFEVGDRDTAAALGSGDVPVLATPRVVAWLEAATVLAVRDAGLLPAGTTSVGTRIEVEHAQASPVGAVVRARARVAEVDGRVVRLDVEAVQGDQRVAYGQVVRAIVDRERFLARVGT